MRIVLVSLLAVIFTVGCREGVHLPTAPAQPPQRYPPSQQPSVEVYLEGFVFDSVGRCIAEATVDATVEGQARPAVTTGCPQKFSPNYFGYQFKDLRDGQKVTLRASKTGYLAEELHVTVSGDIDGMHRNVNFYLPSN